MRVSVRRTERPRLPLAARSGKTPFAVAEESEDFSDAGGARLAKRTHPGRGADGRDVLPRGAARSEPPFVGKETARRSQGQTLCILEAMKLMNEVKAEHRRHRPVDPCGERRTGRVRPALVRARARRRPPAGPLRGARVHARAHRQPRRDRRAGHSYAARDGHPRRRGLLRRPTTTGFMADEGLPPPIGPAPASESYLDPA